MLRLSKLAVPVVLAAVLSSLAVPAMADGYYHRHHSDRGDVAAAGVIGLIGGTMLGAALASPPPPPVYYEPPAVYYEPVPPPVVYRPAPVVVYQQPAPIYAAMPGDHQAWCASRYRSYNLYDNTWTDNRGNLRPCQSPYFGG